MSPARRAEIAREVQVGFDRGEKVKDIARRLGTSVDTITRARIALGLAHHHVGLAEDYGEAQEHCRVCGLRGAHTCIQGDAQARRDVA